MCNQIGGVCNRWSSQVGVFGIVIHRSGKPGIALMGLESPILIAASKTMIDDQKKSEVDVKTIFFRFLLLERFGTESKIRTRVNIP